MAKWGTCPKRAAAEELYDALAMVAAWLSDDEWGIMSDPLEAKIYAALAKADGADPALAVPAKPCGLDASRSDRGEEACAYCGCPLTETWDGVMIKCMCREIKALVA